jgi:hypothetical protein
MIIENNKRINALTSRLNSGGNSGNLMAMMG